MEGGRERETDGQRERETAERREKKRERERERVDFGPLGYAISRGEAGPSRVFLAKVNYSEENVNFWFRIYTDKVTGKFKITQSATVGQGPRGNSKARPWGVELACGARQLAGKALRLAALGRWHFTPR